MHPLEVILQLQLGSDQAAVLSLPTIIASLTPKHFEASSHLQKWISRVTSLMHSKHPGARWAGLCLALQTSNLNRELMTESAQNWIGIALPMLSKHEAPPTWKACIRLLDYIFTSAVEIPEFQRQLATPNVPKFSVALISFAEKNEDPDVCHIALVTLTHLVSLYPTLYRTLHPSLSSLSLRLISGSSISPTPLCTMEDACSLHAVLHFTGGKVGAAPLWRKSLDTALANAWFAFGALRTTFPPLPRTTLNVQHTFDTAPTDPVVAIPLSLDRLKCSVYLIQKLLTAVTLRPVPVPVGELVKIALYFLRCTPDEAVNSHPDVTQRALEISVIPSIWQLGCDFVAQLAKSVRHYLTPHLSRIVSHVTHQLEQPLSTSQRIPFLRVLPPLLENTHGLHAPIPPTRLVKTLLPPLTTLLSSKTEVQQQLQGASTSASKKGKKRARAYEGDEIFRVGRGVLLPTPEDGESVVAALEALDLLLGNPHLAAPIRTLAARLLVTLLLELPRHAPATLSRDLALHGHVYARVLALCNRHVLASASGWINSAVGLVVHAVGDATDGSNTVMQAAEEAHGVLDMLLHPRLPPLLRAHPPLEAIALFRSESEKEDKEAREALSVGVIGDTQSTVGSVVMTTATITEHAAPTTSTQTQSRNTGSPGANTVTSISIVEAPEVPTPLLIAQASVPSQTDMGEQARHSASPSAPVPMRQDTAVARIRQYEDSEEDKDEEMPEIDMRSDSD